MTAGPLTLLWARRPAGRVLACARAVASWRRGLVGEAGRAGMLRRLAAWFRVLSAPPPPLLQNEPYGILPTIVDETGERSDNGGRTSGRRGRTGADSPAARAARDLGRAANRRRRIRLSSLVPEPVPAGADVELPRASVRRRRPLPAAPAPSRRRKLSLETGVGRERDGATFAEVVAGRAARRLSAAATAGSPRDTTLEVAGERSSRSGAASAAPTATGGAEAVLAGQWSTALAGRPAPADLLVRLSRPRRERVDVPGEASRQPVPDAPPAAPLLTPETSGDPVRVSSDSGGQAGPPLPDDDPATVMRLPTQAPPPLATAPAGRQLDEPLRALAADVPAQGLDPRAEAAARLRVVSVEQGAHGAELDDLAAKVKRILDEEARRHGIDV
jgi:hypothetical protein